VRDLRVDSRALNPALFIHANNDLTIAREEIFGPVLTVIPYLDDTVNA